MPEYHYRQLSTCLETLPICERNLQDSIQSGSSFGDQVIIFSLGARFGALTYVAIRH